jgi:hypothetical protein
VQDPGEEGIAGVTVRLFAADGTTLLATTTTDANGAYLFAGLNAGTYTVVVTDTAGKLTGYTATYDFDGIGTQNQAAVTLAEDQVQLAVDFGYLPGGSGAIGDQLFEDVNNNGVQDPSEPFINKAVTVNLYVDSNGDGLLDAGDLLIATTASDAANGTYGFTGLAEGLSYLVQVDTTDQDLIDYFAPNSFQVTTGAVLSVPNLAGSVLDADFGFWAVLPASIGDEVFIDVDGDGLYDPAIDLPLANITVSLYRDLNGDGIADAGEFVSSTSSGPDGSYGFTGLGPDDYIVVVDTADPDLPGGFFAVLTQYVVPLTAGQTVTTADFPLPRAAVEGRRQGLRDDG